MHPRVVQSYTELPRVTQSCPEIHRVAIIQTKTRPIGQRCVLSVLHYAMEVLVVVVAVVAVVVVVVSYLPG